MARASRVTIAARRRAPARSSARLLRRRSARATTPGCGRLPLSTARAEVLRKRQSRVSQAGLRVEHAVGLERLQRAFQPRLEGVHSAPAAPCARPCRAGSPSTWPMLGSAVGEVGRQVTARLSDHRHRECRGSGCPRASKVRKASTMRGEKPSPTTMPSMSRGARGAWRRRPR